MKTWGCSCGAANDMAQRVCDMCGAERQRGGASNGTDNVVTLLPPQYREVPKREYARALPTDRCSIPNCDKTVAEHQAELKEALKRIEVKRIVAFGLSNRRPE